MSAQPDLFESRRDQIYPRLSGAQIARLEPHGKRIRAEAGEVLFKPGDRNTRLLVILSGRFEVVRMAPAGEEPVVVYGPGQFSGEMATLRGAGALAIGRDRESAEILALDMDHVRAVIQSDSELGEILLRAFILRRMRLLSSQPSDVVVIGSRHSSETLRIEQFLTRNGFPYASLDA